MDEPMTHEGDLAQTNGFEPIEDFIQSSQEREVLFSEEKQENHIASLQPATAEGISFAKITVPTQPGVGTQGRGHSEQGGGRQPRGYTRRGFLGAAAATLGVVLAGGGAAFLASRGGDDPSQTRPEHTPVAGGGPVETPDSDTPTVTSTTTPTETPVSTQKEAPGLHKSIEEMPISPDKKAAIKELLKGSEPVIIADGFIIAIEDGLKTRPDTIPYANKQIKVSQLHDLELNSSGFENPVAMIQLAVDMGNFNAWKQELNDQTTSFEQYQEMKSIRDFPFTLWAYEGNSDSAKFQTVSENDPIILKFLATADKGMLVNADQFEYNFSVLNGVKSMGIFAPNPGGFGTINDAGDRSKYAAAYNIAVGLGAMSAHVPKDIISGRYALANEFTRLLPLYQQINKAMNPTATDKTYGNSVLIPS